MHILKLFAMKYSVEIILDQILYGKRLAAQNLKVIFRQCCRIYTFYSKSDLCNFYPQYIKGNEDKDAKNYPYIEENTGRRYGSFDFTQKGQGEAKIFWGKSINPPKGKHWIWTQDKIDEGISKGIIFMTKSGLPRLKRYLDVKKGIILATYGMMRTLLLFLQIQKKLWTFLVKIRIFNKKNIRIVH